MIPTLETFTRALVTPDLSLTTLCDARVLTDANGLPALHRTTRFAEAGIEWRGERWLLFLPLSPAALPRIERTASALRRINSDWLADYRILSQELRWHDGAGRPQSCDLVLQHLPAGRDFDEALYLEHAATLHAALDALEEELRRIGLVHNNLKAANLRWSGGRFIPLRYHDAQLGSTADGDREAFAALRRQIDRAGGTDGVSDVCADYNPLRRLEGHRWTSHVFEGLVCVEDDAGYGYVDTDNRPVIAPQFLWAGDFREGRAEVQTSEGMGLIDRTGRFIIPPQYEIVDYIPAESVVRVRQNGLWALFDYLGRRLTEFGTKCE